MQQITEQIKPDESEEDGFGDFDEAADKDSFGNFDQAEESKDV